MTSERPQRLRLQRQILEAAVRLRETADSSYTARELATEAGVSTSSVYRYFANLEEVRLAAAEASLADAWQEGEELRDEARGLGQEECRTAVRYFIEEQRRIVSSGEAISGLSPNNPVARQARKAMREFVRLAGSHVGSEDHATQLVVFGLGAAIRYFLDKDPERIAMPEFQNEIADMAWAYLVAEREI